MKKRVLTITSVLLLAASSFAQFTAAGIWSINRSVDPMPHSALNFSFFTLTNLTYSSTGVPLTASSTTQPGLPLPKFKITSTITGNAIVCISSEQEGADPWEDKERATFKNNGSIDTSIIVEESNSGSAFEFRQKITYQEGANANQYIYLRYSWLSAGEWKLNSKNFYYLSNGKIDSVAQYNYTTPNDSSRVGYQLFYYSNGLDSTHTWNKDLTSNAFELNGKTIVDQKENGKTKKFSIYDFDNGAWRLSATFTYSNGPASSLNDFDANSAFSIYPNPATNNLNIALGEEKNADLIICDMQGKVVSTGSTQQQTSQLNIEALNNGIYFLTIKTEEGIATKKFIKQ